MQPPPVRTAYVPADLVSRSWAFAQAVCDAWATDERRRFRIPVHKNTKNKKAQFVGRLGEVGLCLYLGVNVERLNWGLKPDKHVDLHLNKLTVDVKSTNHPRAKYLIWQPDRTKKFEKHAAQAFVFARVTIPEAYQTEATRVDLLGLIGKRRFLAEHQVAVEGRDKFLPGTWFMDYATFSDPDLLRRYV